MMKNKHTLGIDIGSVSVGLAVLDGRGHPVQTDYQFHHGQPRAMLKQMLASIDMDRIGGIAATASTPAIIQIDHVCDNRVAEITACLQRHRRMAAILVVGAERFGLIRFDDHGQYHSFKSNTGCAAGTGSFLDQQASRLGLNGIAELSQIAADNTGAIPKIASRCAVFAKTDLVHAQQEGYRLAEICDGLCHGLAKNIVDTLFTDPLPDGPVVFIGGVANNRAVARHVETLIQRQITCDRYGALYGAIGAALDGAAGHVGQPRDAATLFISPARRLEKSFYPPLQLSQSHYPDFAAHQTHLFAPQAAVANQNVEVDLYQSLGSDCALPVWLGLDIGSTSTKAVLLGPDATVLAGFYTRTAGQPVRAVMGVFAAIDDLAHTQRVTLSFLGAGTTGSGRKFAGKIIGADRMIDEITAHARAAVELMPEVDTIIEIGGQDAKFTTLQNGRVTFSVMNTVCAAGTGSFIEEQAAKLGCALTDYAARAINQHAPMASDRCTVFMERDLNHYLTEGYDVDQVLAAALHSVRENYLTKVALRNSIGKRITFQGATAKNRALVAAFEQGLNQPIHVSAYCHLTGALGTALMLRDEAIGQTAFRGIDLYRKPLPVHSEVCDLCHNHCKLTVTQIQGETVAYGFLCGRDYDTRQFVNRNRSGFNLARVRRRAMHFEPRGQSGADHPTIGIPAALHLVADLAFWRYFFDQLGIPTRTSDACADAVKIGKKLAGAEFCAPMAELHGHVAHLLETCDYIFLPAYLEQKSADRNQRRQYCYYTQYAATLAVNAFGESVKHRFITPLANYLYTGFYTKLQIYQALKALPGRAISFFDIAAAYDRAVTFNQSCRRNLVAGYLKQRPTDDIHVVLLGRPYTVLPATMNKGIPDIFGSLGIKAFYQDMAPPDSASSEAVKALTDELPWHFAAAIIQAAASVADTPGAYPVYISAFKCTPDAFALEYFKALMAAVDKPYLILQLDDHDSNVGYETRIEAAVRAFRNHFETGHANKPKRVSTIALPPALTPKRETRLTGKTLLIPNWDPLSLRLVVANLRREGIDARLLEETEAGVQKGLRHNSGQCIPLNIVAQEFIDYVEKYDLDPARTVLWSIHSSLTCNLAMFPHHIQTLLANHGNGMQHAGVYRGGLSFLDISLRAPLNTYYAYLFGGNLRRLACKIRPYETHAGETDQAMAWAMDILEDAFAGNRPKIDALTQVIQRFEQIDRQPGRRPKVAIFGDLYVRDNRRMNQDLIRLIEAHGGEVITTPYSSYAKMTAQQYLRKWFREGKYLDVLTTKAIVTLVKQMERTYEGYFESILGAEPDYDQPPEKILSAYNIRVENTGESMDNILKIYYLARHYPDLSLFVQTNPAFCCPSLVTEAMARQIEKNTGIPVVNITYDGTGSRKNDVIVPYLKFSNRRHTGESRLRRPGQTRFTMPPPMNCG